MCQASAAKRNMAGSIQFDLLNLPHQTSMNPIDPNTKIQSEIQYGTQFNKRDQKSLQSLMEYHGAVPGFVPPSPPLRVPPGKFWIEIPATSDVLFGRGTKINHHPGNVQFRRIVAEWKDLYLSTKRQRLEKSHICAFLVNQIRHVRGGRFLRFDIKQKKWIEVGDEGARKKTGQALREDATEIRAELKKQRNYELTDSIIKESIISVDLSYANSVDLNSDFSLCDNANASSMIFEPVSPLSSFVSVKKENIVSASEVSPTSFHL